MLSLVLGVCGVVKVVMLRAPIWVKVPDGRQRHGRDYRKVRRLASVVGPLGVLC